MATRAERARANEQMRSARAHAASKKAKHDQLAARHKRPASQESEHAGRKATQEFEPHIAGTRPTRKSSRKGANRLRADVAVTRREEAVQDTPAFRHALEMVHTKKVRGHR